MSFLIISVSFVVQCIVQCIFADMLAIGVVCKLAEMRPILISKMKYLK